MLFIWKKAFPFFAGEINSLFSLERKAMLYLFWYNEASIFYETLNLAKMMLMKGNKSHKFFFVIFLTKGNKILLYFLPPSRGFVWWKQNVRTHIWLAEENLVMFMNEKIFHRGHKSSQRKIVVRRKSPRESSWNVQFLILFDLLLTFS